MSSSGFTTTFPRAIDDENLCSSTSSFSPHSARPQVGLSLTSFFIETIKLWELTEKIVNALYPDTATRRRINNIGPTNGNDYSDAGFDVLVNLETAWTRLYNDIPPELRWSRIEANSIRSTGSSTAAPESTRKWLSSQQSVLHTRYACPNPIVLQFARTLTSPALVLSADSSGNSFLYVKLLIYRPLFLRVYREKLSEQMRSSKTQTSQHTSPTTIQSHFATRFAIECFQTAEELVTLVHKLHRTKGTNAWWYTIFCKAYHILTLSLFWPAVSIDSFIHLQDAYFTGIVIILTRFSPPLTEVVGITRIDQSWVLCQEILNHMIIYGDHAKRCLASLQALRSRLTAWESGEHI